mmetsp:Transcript_4308/g.14133  ORF Transcript_4308/g.14133 Transcript_4308/m.14133 type:complete len:211 (+) Transcript_4308:218-850(+)
MHSVRSRLQALRRFLRNFLNPRQILIRGRRKILLTCRCFALHVHLHRRIPLVRSYPVQLERPLASSKRTQRVRTAKVARHRRRRYFLPNGGFLLLPFLFLVKVFLLVFARLYRFRFQPLKIALEVLESCQERRLADSLRRRGGGGRRRKRTLLALLFRVFVVVSAAQSLRRKRDRLNRRRGCHQSRRHHRQIQKQKRREREEEEDKKRSR